MGLTSLGTLPVSALNIGLGASLPFLNSKILDLQASISGLQIALAAQLQLGINLPSITLPSIAAAFEAQLANLPTLLNPLTWVTLGADVNVAVGLQLGLVELNIAAQAALQATFQAGLSAGSLSAWSYSGRSVGFGEALAYQNERGWGGIAQGSQVQALIVATESPASWGSFGFGFSTGASAKVAASGALPRAKSQVPGSGPPAHLVFEGVLNGGQLNTGVLRVKALLDLFILKLKGFAVGLRLQLGISIGLNLPSLGSLTASLSAVAPSIALQNLLTVKLDLVAAISGLQLQIQVILQLIADISASLSAGGLSVWSYAGAAGELGSSLRLALAGGLPGGSGPETTAYGIVIATQLPSAFAAFGGIFMVG